MKIKFISYGHKYYEEIGESHPPFDFLFNLRDMANPFWVPELKELNGTDSSIRFFFEKDQRAQERLKKIIGLSKDFIEDFVSNKHRDDSASLTIAFKCTGGKHRSVYFAQAVYDAINNQKHIFDRAIEVEIDHVDLPRYLGAKS